MNEKDEGEFPTYTASPEEFGGEDYPMDLSPLPKHEFHGDGRGEYVFREGDFSLPVDWQMDPPPPGAEEDESGYIYTDDWATKGVKLMVSSPETGMIFTLDDSEEEAEEGKKFDDEKPMFDLIPPNAELEVAKVITYGASKYGPDNWKLVKRAEKRYMAAARRHLNAYLRGEEEDSESGLHHLAHAVTSLMFVLELRLGANK